MKNEMRTDLAAINFKIDDINSVKSFKIRKWVTRNSRYEKTNAEVFYKCLDD
jgi:hypothetical protein